MMGAGAGRRPTPTASGRAGSLESRSDPDHRLGFVVRATTTITARESLRPGHHHDDHHSTPRPASRPSPPPRRSRPWSGCRPPARSSAPSSRPWPPAWPGTPASSSLARSVRPASASFGVATTLRSTGLTRSESARPTPIASASAWLYPRLRRLRQCKGIGTTQAPGWLRLRLEDPRAAPRPPVRPASGPSRRFARVEAQAERWRIGP